MIQSLNVSSILAFPEAEVEEDKDDPFEGEELLSLQLLVNSLNASCPVQEFVCCDDDLEVWSGPVDPSDPEWRTKVREDVLVQNHQDPEILEEIGTTVLCVDDEKEKAPEINSNQDIKGMKSFGWSCLNQQICFRK